ncbi:MAG: alpha/beta hydrolase [Pseudomonadales bacterium]
MPSPEVDAMIQSLLSQPIVGAPSLADERAGYDEMLKAVPLPADAVITANPIGDVPADWVSVAESKPSRAILYVHGGGYVIGSHEGYREFATRLARVCQARVLVLGYRLAPENPYPAAVNDAVAAYQAIRATPGVEQVAIAGDSGGGGLALATMLAIKQQHLPQADCGICMSPWTDLTISGATAQPGAVEDPMISLDRLKEMARDYASGSLEDPLVSPLMGDPAGLPPLYIAVGTREALLDDSRRFIDKATAAGVTVETEIADGLIHIWPVFPNLPESAETLRNIGQFADQHLG